MTLQRAEMVRACGVLSFWFRNVLRATAQRTSKSALSMVCFAHFHFEMCFAPQRAHFHHVNFQKWFEIARKMHFHMCFASQRRTLFRPQIIGKTVFRDFATLSRAYIFFLLILSLLIFFLLFLFSSLTIPTFAFPSVHIVGSLAAKLLSKIMSFAKRQMDTDRCFGMSLEACLSRQGLFVICLLSVLQLHDSSPTFGRRTAVSNGTTFWPTSCVGPGWTAVPQKTICKLKTDAVTLSSAFLFPGPFVTGLALWQDNGDARNSEKQEGWCQGPSDH